MALVEACPDTDAILAFAQGTLEPEAREEVARHVDACHDCTAVVREAAWALGDGSAGPTRAEGPPPTVAQTPSRGAAIGRYIVLGPLGRGGLGEVLAAYDPELDRRVAIKLLTTSSGQGDAGRFERRLVLEGRALAKLSHPHVVGIHDVGTLGGRVFIAMELVDGLTFGAWLAAAPRTWQQIRDVMLGAAAGLDEAHRAGLVHRDFKPSNVIVDQQARAKVVDFGLARAAAESVGRDAPADPRDPALPIAVDPGTTRTGAVVGTPAYMAPEQMLGADVDARADQFAYCVTLYEALFGCRPFAGRSLPELLQAIEGGRPREPTLDRQAPAWLRRAIVQGLAFDRERRFASIHALTSALTQDRGARRWPWLAAAGALALAGTAALSLRGEPPSTSSSTTAEIDARVHEARAAAARSYFVYPPPDDPEYRTANRIVVELEAIEGTAAAAAQQRAAALRDEFADTLVRLADRLWDAEGGAPFAIDYYAQALVFDPQLPRARERATLTPGELASLRAKAADLSFTAAELAAAEPLAVIAAVDDVERKRRLATLYARDRGPSVSTTARLERVLGNEVGAAVAAPPQPAPRSRPLDAAVPAAAARPAGSVPATKAMSAAEARAAGRRAFAAGRFGEAEALLERALAQDPKDDQSAHALAELHFERGATDDAVELALRAVTIRPRHAAHRLLLGDCLRKLGRIDDARTHYQSALELGDETASARLAKLDGQSNGGGAPR